MPIIEAGFVDSDGNANLENLTQFGPTIRVSIGHFRAEDESNVVPKEDESTIALVDTGASLSCIDIALAEKLELPIVDTMTIGGSDGAKEHNVYLAQIQIPDLRYTQYGLFAGVDLQGGAQPHQALLGRTFLRDAIMIYDGFRGQVTITVL